MAQARLAALLGPRRAAAVALLMVAAGRGDLPYDDDFEQQLDVILGTVQFRGQQGAGLGDDVCDRLSDLVVRGQVPRRS